MSAETTTLESAASSAPVPSSAPVQSSTDWERVWNHRHSWQQDERLLEREERSHRFALILERIEDAFGSVSGLETIELGSGRGDLSALLARRGARVTLLDSCDKALDQARQRFDRLDLPAKFECADMFQQCSEREGRFDVAISSGVIEHFADEDRSRVIGVHHDVLRPGGMTAISVPHAGCPSYRLWKLYLELRGWWPYGMELPYTRRELEKRARSVGFQRCETRCMGFWHSVGAHWMNNVFKRSVDWSDRRSMLDPIMGFTLVLIARRAMHPHTSHTGPSGGKSE